MCNLRHGKYGNLDRMCELDMKLFGPKGIFEKVKITSDDIKKVERIMNKIIKLEIERLEAEREPYDFTNWPQPRSAQ